jgi:hypothetical protein
MRIWRLFKTIILDRLFKKNRLLTSIDYIQRLFQEDDFSRRQRIQVDEEATPEPHYTALGGNALDG